jgi:hypothetical protein
MQPAIFHVKFTSSLRDFGEGLAIFKDGKINGGDHGYLYIGSYEMTDAGVSGRINVKRWNPSVTSVFGNLAEFELNLNGSLAADGSTFSASGTISQMPQMSISINGRKLADAA